MSYAPYLLNREVSKIMGNRPAINDGQTSGFLMLGGYLGKHLGKA
jgi:hypothetical protein